MEKLKMHSPDLTQENIARIQGLFPNCVTEARDKNGNLKLAVDFDQLRQELSDSIVEGPQERYHLNWPGKREALLTANAPIAKTLRPCREESVNFDSTKNIFIEGDNLEALKLLQESYLGKVKMIYIDPPYNTGNDFIYEDDFAENTEEFLRRSNQKDEEGNRLVTNTESNGRFHSDWLTMMYPRLKLARNLLRDDGFILSSIDGREIDNLVKLFDEIYGQSNRLGTFIWRKKSGGGMADSAFVTEHEYIVVYRKSEKFQWKDHEVPIEISEYSNEDENGNYKLLKLAKWGNTSRRVDRPTMYFSIKDPDGNKNFPIAPDGSEGRWRMGQKRIDELLNANLIEFKRKNDTWVPYEKIYFNPNMKKCIKLRSILYDIGGTGDGTDELTKLFELKDYFDNPKPTSLIKILAQNNTVSGDIILDFFAGSSSTAHAILQLNAQDGCHRRFIMIQVSEECNLKSEAYKAGYRNIAEVSQERIRRAGQKIQSEITNMNWAIDIGFRVFKIDTSNMKEVYYRPDDTTQAQLDFFTDNIKHDRTDEDLLFQVLQDWGVYENLSLPIRKEIVQGKNVFFVDENALVACFDKNLTEEFVKKLTEYKPLRVVFRDTGFASDAVKINVEQIFKQMSPETEVRTI